MKKKTKKIILLIIAIIVFVAIIVIRNLLIANKAKNKQYNSLDDFQNPKEVIEYMGGQYIKENESTDENFKLDIYAKFKVDLYTGEISNEEHYREMIRIMAYTLKFDNFRIADEEKQILIAVICNKENSSIERTYINGYDNYFAKENSKIDFNKMGNVELTEFNIQSPELIQLINENWNKGLINTSNIQDEFDNYIYLNNGIAIRNVYKNVFNIVFKNGYKEDVLNGINTSTSLKDVIKKLGEPTFGSIEEGLIGYKGHEIYAFFSLGEISIYRVEKYENTEELINILKRFKDDRNVKKFVSAITDMWKDYDLYRYDTKYVNLIYSLKGIKIQFNVTDSHGLIVGNNYVGNRKDLVKLQEELGLKEIYFENTDFVYETEQTRKNDVRG